MLIIARLLNVPYWVTERHTIFMPNREQRDLIIKVDEGLNDHFTDIPRAPTTLGVCPCRLNIVHVSYDALPFTRTAHNRLDNERYADRVNSLQVSFTGICEPVVRCLQTQLFRGKLPDPLPIHR